MQLSVFSHQSLVFDFLVVELLLGGVHLLQDGVLIALELLQVLGQRLVVLLDLRIFDFLELQLSLQMPNFTVSLLYFLQLEDVSGPALLARSLGRVLVSVEGLRLHAPCFQVAILFLDMEVDVLLHSEEMSLGYHLR